jgi:hypothetical protein
MPRRPRPRAARPAQLALGARGARGGWRARAGRPRKPAQLVRGHRTRPALASRFPVHVTLKVRPDLPNLRRGDCYAALRHAFRRGNDRFGFRLAHYSVQSNHLHLVCEAHDARALTRGMQGLAIRMARRLNRYIGRRGRVFAERYHARILRTPTEVRNALCYVLNNIRHHPPSYLTFAPHHIDERSSGAWFDGWQWPPGAPPRPPPPTGACPVVAPVTWLLNVGWRLRGLLATDEVPGG